MIHSNVTMDLSRTISEIKNNFAKITNFSDPVYLTPPLKEFPLGFFNDVTAKKY